MGRKITDLQEATDEEVTAATLYEIVTPGGQSKSATGAQIASSVRLALNNLWGSLEFTLTEGMLSDGNTTDGFSTFTHADLIGKVNLTLIFINSDKIHRTERTYNSTAGTIVLSAVKFYPTQVVYVEFKKA